MTKNKGVENSFADNTVFVPIADGIEDVLLSLSYLSEAMECASVAVSFSSVDSGDFIEGTLHVLLQAVNSIEEKTSELLDSVRNEIVEA